MQWMAYFGGNSWLGFFYPGHHLTYPFHAASFQSKDKFLGAVSTNGFGFCSVILQVFPLPHLLGFTESSSIPSGWDIHDTVYSRELLISNRANGYRDLLAVIDLSTYRRIPWEDNVPFFLVSFLDPTTRQPLTIDPRGILRITMERAEEIGRQCIAGVEYEVYLLLFSSRTFSDIHAKVLQFQG